MDLLSARSFRFIPDLSVLVFCCELVACLVLLQAGERLAVESTEERRLDHIIGTSHALTPAQWRTLGLGFGFKTFLVLTFSLDALVFLLLRAWHGAHVGVHFTRAGIARAVRAHVLILSQSLIIF